MKTSAIDWPWKPMMTLNPVVGCLRQCPYCYARRMYNRFKNKLYEGRPFTDLIYYDYRLNDACLWRKSTPPYIFIGSMSDIEFWKPEWIKDVLKTISDKWYSHHTYIFLSKNPNAYNGFSWPKNTLQGLTLTCDQLGEIQQLRVDEIRKCRRPFLSIEPLLGNCKVDLDGFEKIIVGAMTGPGAVPVKQEWIQSIKDHAPKDKIHWKRNIREAGAQERIKNKELAEKCKQKLSSTYK